MTTFKIGDHAAWDEVPSQALVVSIHDARRHWHYRNGTVGWYVGGGPITPGHDIFHRIPPLGNMWPQWSAWTGKHTCRIAGLALNGDETREELEVLAAAFDAVCAVLD